MSIRSISRVRWQFAELFPTSHVLPRPKPSAILLIVACKLVSTFDGTQTREGPNKVGYLLDLVMKAFHIPHSKLEVADGYWSIWGAICTSNACLSSLISDAACRKTLVVSRIGRR